MLKCFCKHAGVAGVDMTFPLMPLSEKHFYKYGSFSMYLRGMCRPHKKFDGKIWNCLV